MEVRPAKSCAFECFGGVVNPLREGIGVGAIEGVDDVFFPIAKHFGQGVNSGNFNPWHKSGNGPAPSLPIRQNPNPRI